MDNVFSLNWAPLDVRPLRATFDKLFVYLENLKDSLNRNPTILFEQEVEERLNSLQAKLEFGRRELDAPVVAQSEVLAALDKLHDNIERTQLILVNLKQ